MEYHLPPSPPPKSSFTKNKYIPHPQASFRMATHYPPVRACSITLTEVRDQRPSQFISVKEECDELERPPDSDLRIRPLDSNLRVRPPDSDLRIRPPDSDLRIRPPNPNLRILVSGSKTIFLLLAAN